MILGFKTKFKAPILAGKKKHSLRNDPKGRWKPGMKIHMVTNMRTAIQQTFSDEHKCTAVQDVVIVYHGKKPEEVLAPNVMIDGRELDDAEVLTLARNDGFESLTEFMDWFPEDCSKRLIHWTDLRY